MKLRLFFIFCMLTSVSSVKAFDWATLQNLTPANVVDGVGMTRAAFIFTEGIVQAVQNAPKKSAISMGVSSWYLIAGHEMSQDGGTIWSTGLFASACILDYMTHGYRTQQATEERGVLPQ